MTPAITDTISWWAPFEALETGQQFTTRGRTVTEADVVAFAALTGDWHPQHSDAEWAASLQAAFGAQTLALPEAIKSSASGAGLQSRQLHADRSSAISRRIWRWWRLWPA